MLCLCKSVPPLLFLPMNRRNQAARTMAFGGVMAALGVVIMCLGGLIPVATYVCPMLCTILLSIVKQQCTDRVAWAWYGAVSLLCALLSPDKEAAAVFVFLGYYPILKPRLDTLRLRWLWKVLLFNAAIALMYGLLVYLFGMEQILAEFQELGLVLGIVTLFAGNVTFLLLDRILERLSRRMRG